MRVYKPTVARGSSRHAHHPAPPDRRYVGLYYYSGYWQSWDRVINCGRDEYGTFWEVVEVDVSGNVVGEARRHCTSMEACHFADRPFKPMTIYQAGAVEDYSHAR